jgi:hypothetical protein
MNFIWLISMRYDGDSCGSASEFKLVKLIVLLVQDRGRHERQMWTRGLPFQGVLDTLPKMKMAVGMLDEKGCGGSAC